MYFNVHREDYILAENITDASKKREFYNNVKAGAESGWDFSARWFVGPNGEPSLDLAGIATLDIIPVDLNAFLERNARILARYFRKKNNVVVSHIFNFSQPLVPIVHVRLLAVVSFFSKTFVESTVF